MLPRLPGFEAPEEGVFHAQVDRQAPKKKKFLHPTLLTFPATYSWELQTGYFKSHFLNCKMRVRNTYSTEQE